MVSLKSVFLVALVAALPLSADPGVATHEPVVEKVSPAIVALQCKSPPRAGMGAAGREMSWFGTGTVISEDGAILTSATVVPPDAKPDSILVSFAGGKQMKAEFVCGSDELEVTLVRLPKGKYPYVPLGDSKSLKLGHVVYTFGNCQSGGQNGGVMENDDQVAFAQGEVSGFYKITDVFEGKNWYEGATYKGSVIETTAPLNPGVDGGPLVDAKGRLVGIMTLSYNETRWLGAAIPMHVINDRVEHWQKGEIVKDAPKVVPKKPDPEPPVEEDENAPYFGATLEADEPVIAAIAKGSPASKSRLQAGDRILSIEGKEMKTPASVAKALKGKQPGETITLVVERDAKQLTIKVKLGYQPM
ncbi:MAG: S1C family serine protease [Planctomycetota bacterium]